ncbi:MAG: flavin reductase [Anaerolineales bacterium]|nr:flavin reductase [Anaerolineales bacterium]MCB0013041.1 flavin reductase [Anaerolineales bacterium]
MSNIDSREFRNCCGRFATGITIVTTELEGQRHGMTANGFMSVSLEPPTVLVSVGKRARAHDLLAQSGRYGISILRETQQPLSNHFAGYPVEGIEIPWEELGGVPVIGGTLAQFSVRIMDAHEVGDHTLFIAEVVEMNYDEGKPLLYYYSGYGQFHDYSHG